MDARDLIRRVSHSVRASSWRMGPSDTLSEGEKTQRAAACNGLRNMSFQDMWHVCDILYVLCVCDVLCMSMFKCAYCMCTSARLPIIICHLCVYSVAQVSNIVPYAHVHKCAYILVYVHMSGKNIHTYN